MAKTKKNKRIQGNQRSQQHHSLPGNKCGFVTINPASLLETQGAGPKKKQNNKQSLAKKRNGGKADNHEGKPRKKQKGQVYEGGTKKFGERPSKFHSKKKQSEGIQSGVTSKVLHSKHTKEQRLYYLITRMEEEVGKGLIVIFQSGDELRFVEVVGFLRELTEGRTTGLSLRTPMVQRTLLARRADRALHHVVIVVVDSSVTTELRGCIMAPSSKASPIGVLAIHLDCPGSLGERSARLAVLNQPKNAKVQMEEYFLVRPNFPLQALEEPFPKNMVPKLQARLSVAMKIAKVSCKFKSTTIDGDRESRKLAIMAGLDVEGSSTTKKDGKDIGALQQLDSLRQKLAVLLTQPLFKPSCSPSGTLQKDEIMEKMKLLCMVQEKESSPKKIDDRIAAQTRWLDGAKACDWGGDWEGEIRHGACCDKTSLQLRALHEQYLLAMEQRAHEKKTCSLKKKFSKKERKRFITAGWQPNPSCTDVDQWGGRWGKPCAHNEVVMHQLRPFFPLEVINTRVCSKTSPAPGNESFDGCMEFLSLQCRRKQRAMTVWDTSHFHWISPSGKVTSFEKKRLINLSCRRINFFIKNARHLAIFTQGQMKTEDIFASLCFCRSIGTKKYKLHVSFNDRIIEAIMAYLF